LWQVVTRLCVMGLGLSKRSAAIGGDRLRFIEFQLPTLVEKPPEGDNWIHQIKYDGYRTELVIQRREVQAFTRLRLDGEVRADRGGRTESWLKVKCYEESVYEIAGVLREPHRPSCLPHEAQLTRSWSSSSGGIDTRTVPRPVHLSRSR
jgi:ATP-dependent DNA ligase